MRDSLLALLLYAMYLVIPVSYLHGIYIGFHEGFWSFVLALIILPWGVLYGFFSFF